MCFEFVKIVVLTFKRPELNHYYTIYFFIVKIYIFVVFSHKISLGQKMKYLKSILLVIIFIFFSSSSYLAQQVWVKQNSGTTKLLYMPFFTDQNNGTIVGQQGTILRTTDGGITWNSQYSTTLHSLTSVYFSNANNGVAVGASGTVLKTEDSGETWVNQNSGFVFNFITALSFVNSNVGVAVGENGLIIKTTDRGEN